jgi:hypothetical protein
MSGPVAVYWQDGRRGRAAVFALGSRYRRRNYAEVAAFRRRQLANQIVGRIIINRLVEWSLR